MTPTELAKGMILHDLFNVAVAVGLLVAGLGGMFVFFFVSEELRFRRIKKARKP
jgi:hypothetical protein